MTLIAVHTLKSSKDVIQNKVYSKKKPHDQGRGTQILHIWNCTQDNS